MDGFNELIINGYIHRDIKPENVLVSLQPDNNNQGQIRKVYKVSDFGFATKIDVRGK